MCICGCVYFTYIYIYCFLERERDKHIHTFYREKEMATHISILAWRIPWREEPCGLQFRGRKESDTT